MIRYTLKRGSIIYTNRLLALDNFCLTFKCYKHQSNVNCENIKSFAEIPGPKSYPFIGSIFSFKGLGGDLNILNMEELSQQVQRKYGDLVKLSILNSTQIFTFNPEHIKKVFEIDGEIPIRISLDCIIQYCKLKGRPVTLAHSQGQRWKNLRSASNFIASPQAVQLFIREHDVITNDFIKYLEAKFENNSEIQIKNLDEKIKLLSFELISVIAFEQRINCVDENRTDTLNLTELVNAVDDLFKYMGNLLFGLPLWKYYPTKEWKAFVETLDIIYNITGKFVKEAYEKANKLNENEIKDLHSKKILQQYILNKEKYDLTVEDIIALTIDFFLGGVDTISSTLHFAIYEISRNNKIQETLFDEIKQTIGSSEYVTIDHLAKMHYLKAIIKETLRLHPVAVFLSRLIQEDLILDNYFIPKGSNIMVGVTTVTHLEKYFKNPNVFDPDRWLKNEKANIHPFSSLPFSTGARQCIGRRIAEQELYMTLIKVFKNFKVEYMGEPLGHRVRLMSSPDKPLNVKLIKRT